MTADQDEALEENQRIDKWLWCARFFKTRALAAKFVSSGKLRLERHGETLRVGRSSFLIRSGDRLTYSRKGRLTSIEVLACATRRGPASEARALYKDLSPAARTDDAAPADDNAPAEPSADEDERSVPPC